MRDRTIQGPILPRDGVARDRGQALVVAVLALFALLVVASFVIDVANWHAKGQRAQSAADAAALAAASCLGSSTCSYSSVATTVATANGAGTVSVSTNSAGTQVTVAVTNSAKAAFAGLIGLGSEQVSRSAVAAQSAGAVNNPATCANIGTGDCITIFAGYTCNQTKPSGYPLSKPGVYLDLGYRTNIAGTIVSNGGFNVNQSWASGVGFAASGLYYGASSAGCSSSNLTSNLGLSSYGTNNEYVAGNGANSTTSGTKLTPIQLSSQVQYPEYWGAGATYWSGEISADVNETTPTCTYTATTSGAKTYFYGKGSSNYAYTDGSGDITIYASNATIPSGVFCAPSGTINVTGANSQGDVTLIADDFSGVSGLSNMDLAPCGSTTYSNTDSSACNTSNQLLMMQTGSSELLLVGINSNLQGTVFAPTAFLYANSIGSSSGFLEAAAVEYCALSLGNSFTISGTGPSTASVLGGVSLVQ